MSRGACPADHKHGETTTCYTNHFCGCADCRMANRDRSFYRRHMIASGRADRFESIVDGRGVRRRLQALTAIGWSAKRLGLRLGVTADQILIWIHRDRVTFTTHERVQALYDALSDHPPAENTTGDRISAQQARGRAARNGWARPIDWDDIDLDAAPALEAENDDVIVDEVAVQLALEGTHVRLSRAERHIAVTTLNARGYNDVEISQFLRVSNRTILRDREDLGLPANNGTYEERFAAA